MRYPKIRELIEAIKALIKGPYTSDFPFRPHVQEEKFRGMPEYNEEGCVGCCACSEVCPAKVADPMTLGMCEVPAIRLAYPNAWPARFIDARK